MPIYAYRCESCGHAKDVLQKVSDPVLTTCPSCGGESFRKQLTAAGFQLKGSGWYVTDFRGGSSGAGAPAAPAAAKDESSAASSSTASSSSEGASSASAACGGPCACH